MKPTVGRIVHYWQADGSKEPLAAIITKVCDDPTVVSLHIYWTWMEDPVTNGRWYLQSEDGQPGTWSWPKKEEG